ncbi:MAG TPA: 2-amino-4-hydroxy-6-hydroxymethyldihydropteridine diphosphokinase, partial [Planctomycetaceae bacterium]|nr:2-amino-4-hydroxy-6-hydroxymethyldihydropteridine diphosphokinase [Planctomycetaceae bacterium]
ELLRHIPQSQLGPVSSWLETRAVGDPSAPAYLNAAAGLQTDLEPLLLLDQLQTIEHQLGRVRDRRWGPRTLDLDLLFYGSEVINLPRLIVPHPHLWYRRFVLDPLVEIAGDVVHPERGVSIQELRERLLLRPLACALAGGTSADRAAIVQQLDAEFPQVDLCEWNASESMKVPAIVAWLGPSLSSGRAWADLPAVARLDLTTLPGPAVRDLRDVLHAALG